MNRPSYFAIDLHLTEEVLDPQVAAWLRTEEGQAYVMGVDASTAYLGAFDRDRFFAPPRAANNTRWFAIAMAVAVVLLGWVWMQPAFDPAPTEPYLGIRGGTVQASVLVDGVLVPWDGHALGSGDVVGLTIDRPGRSRAVVVSIDGNGLSTLLYPGPNEPVPRLNGPTRLPGSLTLDDAPGPEFFVISYDQEVEVSVETVNAAWRSGGADAVRRLAGEDTDVLEVPRR